MGATNDPPASQPEVWWSRVCNTLLAGQHKGAAHTLHVSPWELSNVRACWLSQRLSFVRFVVFKASKRLPFNKAKKQLVGWDISFSGKQGCQNFNQSSPTENAYYRLFTVDLFCSGVCVFLTFVLHILLWVKQKSHVYLCSWYLYSAFLLCWLPTRDTTLYPSEWNTWSPQRRLLMPLHELTGKKQVLEKGIVKPCTPCHLLPTSPKSPSADYPGSSPEVQWYILFNALSTECQLC